MLAAPTCTPAQACQYAKPETMLGGFLVLTLTTFFLSCFCANPWSSAGPWFCVQTFGMHVHSPRQQSPQVLVSNPAYRPSTPPLPSDRPRLGVVVSTVEEGPRVRRLRLHRPGGQVLGDGGEPAWQGDARGGRRPEGSGSTPSGAGSGEPLSAPSAAAGLHQYFHKGAGRQTHRHGAPAGTDAMHAVSQPSSPGSLASPMPHVRATFNPHFSEGWCECGCFGGHHHHPPRVYQA